MVPVEVSTDQDGSTQQKRGAGLFGADAGGRPPGDKAGEDRSSSGSARWWVLAAIGLAAAVAAYLEWGAEPLLSPVASSAITIAIAIVLAGLVIAYVLIAGTSARLDMDLARRQAAAEEQADEDRRGSNHYRKALGIQRKPPPGDVVFEQDEVKGE